MPPTLPARIKSSLKNATHIVFLGMGSDLRRDDAAGIQVAELLQQVFRQRRAGLVPEILVLAGGTAPENMTGAIRQFQPSHIVIVDAAQFGARAGVVRLLDPENLGEMVSSTHRLPIKLMLDYLAIEARFQLVVIGIQPGSLHYGESMSAPVAKAVQRVVAALRYAVAR